MALSYAEGNSYLLISLSELEAWRRELETLWTSQSIMLLRFPVFADPMYSAEMMIEFDPQQVVHIEQKQISLFLRGSHWVTYITLQSGAKHALNGRVADQIRSAQQVPLPDATNS